MRNYLTKNTTLLKIAMLGLSVMVGVAMASPASAALTINGTTVTSDGALTMNSAAASNIILGSASTSGTIAIGGASGTGTVTLGQATTAQTLTLLSTANTGAQVINIADGATAAAMDVDILSGAGTAGAATLNMADNPRVTAVTLANGANAAAMTVDIASAAAAANRTVTISGGVPTTGTDTLNLGTGNYAKAINIGTGTKGNTISIGTGINDTAQTVSIATGASAANSTVNILTGTGTAGAGTLALGDNPRVTTVSLANGANAAAMTVDIASAAAAANRTVTISGGVPTTGTDTLNLGTGNYAKAINIGTGTLGNTISIGTGVNSVAQTINIATGAAAANSTVSIFSGVATSGTQTLNLMTGTGGTKAINMGTGDVVHTIKIGDHATPANAITIGGAASTTTVKGVLTVGVDDTGHDVTFFGATAGKKWLWDESADKMIVTGTATIADGLTVTAGGATLTAGDVTLSDGRLVYASESVANCATNAVTIDLATSAKGRVIVDQAAAAACAITFANGLAGEIVIVEAVYGGDTAWTIATGGTYLGDNFVEADCTSFEATAVDGDALMITALVMDADTVAVLGCHYQDQ